MAPPPFLMLKDSTLWGTGGSLFDLTSRVSAPFPLDLINTAALVQDETLRNVTNCSADNSTWNAIQARYAAAQPGTAIWWPRCVVNVTMGSSGTVFNMDKDRVGFIGTEGQSSVYLLPDPTAPTRWNPATGDVSRGPLRGVLFNIADVVEPPERTCAWTSGFALGTRRIQLAATCNLESSGPGAWGIGDIVRLRTDQIPNAGTNDPIFVARVTCVDGRTTPRVGSAAGCSELTGDSQIQISDPLPMDYSGAQYFFGALTGQTVDLMERVGAARGGIGNETSKVAEGVFIKGITFNRKYWGAYDSFQPAVRIANAVDVELSHNHFHKWGGGTWLTMGQNQAGVAARVNVFGNRFESMIFKSNCFGKITALAQTNPVQLTVQTGDCAALKAGLDRIVFISEDSNMGALAGTYQVKPATLASGPSGSPEVSTFALLGVDGAGLNTNPGGIVAVADDYSMAALYCQNPAANVQVVNNLFINSRMGPIVQNGCTSFVFAANYARSTASSHVSRGVFSHGNAGAAGLHTEMNDVDFSETILASSNGQLTRHGDGVNRTIFKNRFVNTPGGQFPNATVAYAEVAGRGRLNQQEDDNQQGASNEEWNIFANVFYDFNGASLIDNAANDGSGAGATPPYQLNELLFQRNRCYSPTCNLDDNFDDSDAHPNPSTIKDTAGTEVGEATPTVPSAWLTEAAQVPTSLFFRSRPAWWCLEAMPFGAMGSHYDDLSGPLTKLPAQIRFESGTCTLP